MISTFVKRFSNLLSERYPNIVLYYEYDPEIDIHFIWHTNADYDNSIEFDIEASRIKSDVFERNCIYNVVFSFMAGNHLTASSGFSDVETTSFSNTDSGVYNVIEVSENPSACDDIVTSSVTMDQGKSGYSIQITTSTHQNNVSDYRENANYNLEFAA